MTEFAKSLMFLIGVAMDDEMLTTVAKLIGNSKKMGTITPEEFDELDAAGLGAVGGTEMRKLISLPTWILGALARPLFHEGHPWKNRKWFTLRVWHAGQTPVCRMFDLQLWFLGWLMLLCVIQLVRRLL